MIFKRDSYFDNLKALLIFLVVLGHMLYIFMENSVVCNFIVNFIYIFHMPLFIFISGYFSKKSKSDKNPLIIYGIPYLILNFILGYITTGNLLVNPLVPQLALWFLLSMIFWKISIKYLINIKGILMISILVSLGISVFTGISQVLSIGKTIKFLPFFILGYKFEKEWVDKIKNKSWLLMILLGFLGIILYIWSYQKGLISYNMLLRNSSYVYLGISNFKGFIIETLIYFPLTIIFSTVILYLIPRKKVLFTYIGRNTMFIYLSHIFIYCILFPKFLNLLCFYVPINIYSKIVITILFSVLITIVLGTNVFSKYYQKFENKLLKVFAK